jgi:ABC-type amino acid transport substrate-binding protein
MGIGPQQLTLRWTSLAGLVLCSLLLLSGCREADLSLQRIQQAGVLRVGLDPSWPPFEYVDPEGEIAGFDVDLARAIGQHLGVEVHLVVSGWEGLYAAMAAGQFDVAISALPYDPWRTQQVAYSISYFNAGPVVVAPFGGEVSKEKDLEGRAVHVEFGSEGDVQARRLQRRVPGFEIVPHDTPREALDAVAADAASTADVASAAVVDAVSARLYLRDDPRLQIVGEPLYDESYVIAVPLGARSLLRAIDQALTEIRENGELERLLDRWLS